MGECCSDCLEAIDDIINPVGSVGLSPGSRVKIVDAIRQVVDSGDCNAWPPGLNEGILLEGVRSWDLEDDDPRFPKGFEEKLKKLLADIKTLFFEGLNEKTQTLHCILVMFISKMPEYFAMPPDSDEFRTTNDTILELLEGYFSTADRGKIGKFDKETKKFIKFLLSWRFREDRDFQRLLKIAKDCMEILQVPLDEEYKRILEGGDQYDAELVELEFKKPESEYADTVSQRELYPKFTNFVQSQKENDTGDYPPEYLDPTIALFREHKLPNPEIIRFLFDISGDVMETYVFIEFFRQVALELNDPFQKEMKQLFEATRAEYKRAVGGNFEADKDAAYKGAPVKTAGRAASKRVKYYGHDSPIDGSILDWVRCAFIVYDTREMMMLYNAILEKYSGGEVIRVKNAFKRGEKGNYGYRAILMNVVYEHHGLKMVVEIQLILLKYLKVRKSMHLFYKIVRASNAEEFVLDVSKVQEVDKTKSKDWMMDSENA